MLEGSAQDMEGMKVAFYNLDSLKQCIHTLESKIQLSQLMD